MDETEVPELIAKSPAGKAAFWAAYKTLAEHGVSVAQVRAEVAEAVTTAVLERVVGRPGHYELTLAQYRGDREEVVEAVQAGLPPSVTLRAVDTAVAAAAGALWDAHASPPQRRKPTGGTMPDLGDYDSAYVAWAALLAVVEDIHQPQYNLSDERWRLAEQMFDALPVDVLDPTAAAEEAVLGLVLGAMLDEFDFPGFTDQQAVVAEEILRRCTELVDKV